MNSENAPYEPALQIVGSALLIASYSTTHKVSFLLGFVGVACLWGSVAVRVLLGSRVGHKITLQDDGMDYWYHCSRCCQVAEMEEISYFSQETCKYREYQ